MNLPGARVRSYASRLFRRETMERVIDPILADLQSEYGQARARGSVWRARACLLRCYVDLARAVVWLGVRHAWDANSRPAGSEPRRIWIVSLAAAAILTAVFTLPPLLTLPAWQHGPAFAVLLSTMVIPQALPLSIPVGLCIGVLWSSRGAVVSRGRLWSVIVTGTAFTALMWVLMEYVVPESNQAFREIAASRFSHGTAQRLERGLNELGLSGLAQRTDPQAVRHFHVLWALCFAAMPLGVLACAVAPYVRRAVSAVIVGILLCNAYIAGVVWADTAATLGAMPPMAAAWIPNTLALIVAAGLLLRRPLLRGDCRV